MTSLTCSEGPGSYERHRSCLPLLVHLSWGLLSRGSAVPSAALKMCEPGVGWGEQWCCVGVADPRVRACVHGGCVMGASRRADERMCTRASVECTRVGVCVTEWGLGITLGGATPRFPWPYGEGAGGAPGRSTRHLGRRRPLQNEMTSRVL